MVEELVAHLLGVDCDEKFDELDQLFYDKYEMDIDQFEKVVNKLLPLIEIWQSPVTKTTYKGFVNAKNKFVLMKTECKDD